MCRINQYYALGGSCRVSDSGVIWIDSIVKERKIGCRSTIFIGVGKVAFYNPWSKSNWKSNEKWPEKWQTPVKHEPIVLHRRQERKLIHRGWKQAQYWGWQYNKGDRELCWETGVVSTWSWTIQESMWRRKIVEQKHWTFGLLYHKLVCLPADNVVTPIEPHVTINENATITY